MDEIVLAMYIKTHSYEIELQVNEHESRKYQNAV